MSLTADKLIAAAQSHLGYDEENGSSKFGKWWDSSNKVSGYARAAWCDMFISYCAQEAAPGDGEKIVGEFAYTPWHAAWFARNGRFGNTPKRGAIVFFDWSGSKSISAIDHVGIVIGTDASGRVVTIEGNTGTPGEVAVRYRTRDTIVGFGYPRYAAKPPAPPSVKAPAAASNAQAPKFPLPSSQWYGKPGKAGARSTGVNVGKIQTQLVKHGYDIAVDDQFGDETHTAVRSFQRKYGYDDDGAVGPLTWPKLWTTLKK